MSVSTVSVVGAGPFGVSIAQAVAAANVPVTVVCLNAASARCGARRSARTLSLRVQTGEIASETSVQLTERIAFGYDLAVLSESDLVIEARSGSLMSRRELLPTLEERMSRGAVLASTLPAPDLVSAADQLDRQDQFVGLRFIDPATPAQRVQVVSLPQTAPGVMAACETFGRWLDEAPDQIASELRVAV